MTVQKQSALSNKQLLIVFAGLARIYSVVVAQRRKQTAAGDGSGRPAAWGEVGSALGGSRNPVLLPPGTETEPGAAGRVMPRRGRCSAPIQAKHPPAPGTSSPPAVAGVNKTLLWKQTLP